MIPREQYVKLLELLPILCVDIILVNPEGQYLLIKRANEPLKDQWWVIGGRVLKGETLEEAAIRKVREETGLQVRTVMPVGYYEDVAEMSPFGESAPQHSVSVVFSASIDDGQKVILDDQSTEWKYSGSLPCNFVLKLFTQTSNFNKRAMKPTPIER